MGEDPYISSKALYHVGRLSMMQQGIPFSPTLLQVDPEAYCNDNCSFCSYREETMYNNVMLTLIDAKVGDTKQLGPVGRPTEKSGWPVELAVTLPQQMKEVGIPAIEITGGGEPTLWRGFDTLVENCQNQEIDVGVVTNASNMTDERAKLLARCVWVRFSIDAPNAEIHQKIHRTRNQDFDRRIFNVQRVVKEKHRQKTDVTIGISYIVTPDNIDYIQNMCELVRGLGVDNLRFSFMYDKSGKAGLTDDQYNGLLPKLEVLQKQYSTDSFKILFDSTRLWTYSKPNTDFKNCYIQKMVWAIGADCNVYPCCIMKYHPEYAYDNITRHTLKEMIESADFLAKQNNLDVTKCFPCWLRTRNQSIEQTQIQPKHSNFL